MPRTPWFKFFAADYLSSLFVQGLEPEQELWYLRLLIASAINLPRGCLPLANDKLWRIAKAPSLEYFEQHAGPILAKFERDEARGLYVIPKIANQLVSNGELSSKRAEAGKKGAARRWQLPSVLPSKPMANAIEADGNLLVEADSDSDVSNSPLPPSSAKRGARQSAKGHKGPKAKPDCTRCNGTGKHAALSRPGLMVICECTEATA